MKRYLMEGLISLGIFAVIVGNAPALIRTWNGHSGMDEFFVVRQFEVDKFTEFGKEPVLYYDRDVRKDFHAHWTATIQKISEDGTFSYFCSGSDHNSYKAGINLSKEKLTVDWIVKSDPSCKNLKTTPGTYRIVISWDEIDRGPYYLPTKMEVVSNVFKILGEGEIINEQAATTSE